MSILGRLTVERYPINVIGLQSHPQHRVRASTEEWNVPSQCESVCATVRLSTEGLIDEEGLPTLAAPRTRPKTM